MLASLLPRFIEPQQGRVLYDGEDIAWATLESLRAETLYVTGADSPLYGTVFDNLRAGNPEISLQQATDAAKMAHAHNFIVRLSNGYETVLGGATEDLDAGQAFRLSLARAILRNPAVLIVEEPRQPLDEDAKAWLSDTYERLLPGRTVIFLPSRLSTLKRVDEVIVIEHGQIAAVGPQSCSSPSQRSTGTGNTCTSMNSGSDIVEGSPMSTDERSKLRSSRRRSPNPQQFPYSPLSHSSALSSSSLR